MHTQTSELDQYRLHLARQLEGERSRLAKFWAGVDKRSTRPK